MRRGEIWTVAGGKDYAGKPRPAVIVQDDSFDATDSVTICAFTTDETDAPLLRLSEQTRISVNSKGYDRIRAAIPTEGITRRTASGVRRIWRTKDTGGEKIHSEKAGGQSQA